MIDKTRGTPVFQKQRLPWPAILVFLFLAAVIAVSGYFFYRKQKKAVFNEEIRQLMTIADMKVAQIDNWLAERMADARLIAQNPDRGAILSAFLRDRSSAARRESVQRWLSSLQTLYHYENVLLLDRQGEVVLAASPHHTMVGGEGRQAVAAARRLRDVVMSDLHSNPQVPHIHLDLVAPLFAGEENTGFVFLRIDPNDFLFPMIQSWPNASPSAETLLIRREGNEVLFLNELRHRRNTALKLRLPVTSRDLPAAMAIKGIKGAVSGRDYRNIAVWSVVQPVEGTKWFMVAKIDRDEIELPLRRSMLAIFLVALSLVLATAMLILYLWQRQNARFRLQYLEMRHEGDEMFRQVFETANVGKSITMQSGEINVNQAFCDMLGYTKDELKQKKWQDLTPTDEIEPTQKMLASLLKNEADTLRFDKRYIHKNGSFVWADVSVAIRRDAAGKPLHFITTVIDRSERRRAEQELQALSMRNQALLEAVPDIIMEVDTNKVYTWANRAGIEFFGDEVIGREASDYFLGEQEVYQVVKPLFNGYEDTIYLESWQRRRDGEKRLLAWWCRVLKDEAGNVTGALSSARDITEIKLAEKEIRRLNEELEQRVLQRTAQLQASNRELEAFSYSVSHDLRAPLRAIEGFSRIVLEEYAPKLDDEARRLLDVITANTRKMGHLIDDLLAFSRLNRQQMHLPAGRPVRSGQNRFRGTRRHGKRAQDRMQNRPLARRIRRPRHAAPGPAEPAGQCHQVHPLPEQGPD